MDVYEDVLQDMVMRGTRQQKFVEYFNEKVAPGRNIRNVMSIGPGESLTCHDALSIGPGESFTCHNVLCI